MAIPESLAVALLGAVSLSSFGLLHGEVLVEWVLVHIFIARR